MRDDRRSRLRLLDVLRLVFSAAAIGLIVFGLFIMRERSRSRGWAATSGTIVSSTVTQFTGKTGTTYRPMVMYGYSVGAVRYSSNRISFRAIVSSDHDAALKAAAAYKPGSAVRVFYDPQDPEQAVLERGANPWVGIVGGGVFAMAAVWMRMLRRRTEPERLQREG